MYKPRQYTAAGLRGYRLSNVRKPITRYNPNRDQRLQNTARAKAAWQKRYTNLLVKEKKFYDVAGAGILNNTIIKNALFIPTQGTSAVNRDGNKVLITSIQVRASMRFDGGDGSPSVASNYTGTSWRFALILDKQPGNSAPILTDVYEDASVWSFVNKNNAGRFEILKEWTGDLNATTAIWDGDSMIRGATHKYVDYYFAKPIPVTFKANGGTYGDVLTNNIMLSACCTINVGMPTFTYNIRFRFVDV